MVSPCRISGPVIPDRQSVNYVGTVLLRPGVETPTRLVTYIQCAVPLVHAAMSTASAKNFTEKNVRNNMT